MVHRRSRSGRWLRAAVVVAPLAFAGGCGGPSAPLAAEPMDGLKLREVGDLYCIHQISKNAAPRSLNHLAAFGNATPSGYEAIRSGEVVVRYGATLPAPDETSESMASDEVLAYMKDVPTAGGSVLMLDRSTRTMSAKEFKAAELAGTESPAK